MDEFERTMVRDNIQEFVRSDVVTVTLNRPTYERTASGGLRATSTTVLPPQRGRLVPFKRRYSAIIVDTQYGDVPELQYILVMEDPVTADVRREDWFLHEGQYFTVESVDIKREARVAAELIYRGGPDG